MTDYNGREIHTGDVLVSRRSGQEYAVLSVETDHIMVKSWVSTQADDGGFPLETCHAFIVKG